MKRISGVNVIKVIAVATLEGEGTMDDLAHIEMEYWSLDGRFLFREARRKLNDRGESVVLEEEKPRQPRYSI